MFATSHDILNLVLSVCAAILTFFLCWALYYFIDSIYKIHRLIKRVENSVGRAEEIIEMVKDKIKNSSAYLMILGEIAKKAMEFVRGRRGKKTAKRKR